MDEREKFRTLIVDETVYKTRLSRKYLERKPAGRPELDVVHAVIPGTILSVDVEPGRRVKRGDRLAVLEAMKMKNPVLAPRNGRIQEVAVRVGEVVTKHQKLFSLDTD